MEPVVKEKTPIEIRDEKNYENQFYEIPEDELSTPRGSNESLYDFLRRTAKSQINYHLNKKTKKKKKKKLLPEVVEEPKDEEEISVSTEVREQLSKKKGLNVKTKLVDRDIKNLTLEKSAAGKYSKDASRVKEMLGKRISTLEAVIGQLNSQWKMLEALKAGGNREQVLKIAAELSTRNESMVKDLEGQVKTVHDTMRQVEKIGQQADYEKNEIKKQCQEELKNAVFQEQEKADLKIRALKDHNKQLSALINRQPDEYKMMQEITEMEQQISQLEAEVTERRVYMSKHSNEVEVLKSRLQEREQELEMIEKEHRELQNILRNQRDDYEYQINSLSSEISNLNAQLSSTADRLNVTRSSEHQRFAAIEAEKDKEIARLKAELIRVHEETHLKLKAAQKDEEAMRREIAELRRELHKIDERNRSVLDTEGGELNRLRVMFEERERQFAIEKEQMTEALNTKEKHRLKQKNEWAEIYTTLKHEIKELKRRVSDLTMDNERLTRQLDQTHTSTIDNELTLKAQNDNLRNRIKEREVEMSNLWDSLSELSKIAVSKGRIDPRDFQTVLSIRKLDEKSRRKFK
jgi:chromosome segregation ATPase